MEMGAMTDDQLLLRGKYVLTDARLKAQGLIPDGGVLVEGTRVAMLCCGEELPETEVVVAVAPKCNIVSVSPTQPSSTTTWAERHPS